MAARKANTVSSEDANGIIANDTGLSKNGQCFDTHSLISNEDYGSRVEAQNEPCSDWERIDTRIDISTERLSCNGQEITDMDIQNETATRFLNELYDKEVDINTKFSNQEVLDIRTAVDELVNLLAKYVGEIDPRFRLQEVIPVGSASEGTQIVRPSEYDYILISEALSKPGAVSFQCNKNDQHYVTATLEDNETRSLFYSCIHTIGSKQSSKLSTSELRKRFRAKVFQASKLCSKLSVKKKTGSLTCTRLKPEVHGPADTVMFEWHRVIKENCLLMKISVDLCLALKIDWEAYNDILQSVKLDVSADFKRHIQNVKSVLFIMPKICPTRFKAAFTETELLLTEELSEHHRKCYKLLKYVVNGEPLPLQTNASKLKYMFQDKTFLPSYALKLLVWHHQFTQRCSEETDLCSCFSRILCRFDNHSKLEDSLKHPVKIGIKAVGYELSRLIGESDGPYNVTLSGKERIRRISKGFKKVQAVSIKKYDFETFCHEIAIRGHGKYYTSKFTIMYAVIVYLLCCSQIVCTGYFALAEQVLHKTCLWVIGSFWFLLGTFILHNSCSPNICAESGQMNCAIYVMVLCGYRVPYLIGLIMLTLSARGLGFYLVVAIHGGFLFVLTLTGHYCINLRLKSFITPWMYPEKD